MGNFRHLGTQLLLGALAFSCGGPTETPGIQQAAIIDGEFADAGDYPGVVALTIDEAGFVVCSAVLLDAQTVLTAAHCIDGHEEWWPADPSFLKISVGTGQEDTSADVHDIASLCNHRGYRTDARNFDIGRIKLATPTQVPVAPVNTFPIDETWIGRTVTLVGFGPDYQQAGPTTQRFGTGTISEVEEATFVVTPNPAQGCSGDSGGAVFYESELGRVLIGLISRGPANCDGYTRILRIDRHVEFAYSSSELGDEQICSVPAPVLESIGSSGFACAHTQKTKSTSPSVLLLLLFWLTRKKKKS